MTLYSRGVYVCAIVVAIIAGRPMPAAAAGATVKVAFWNVMSGKGVDALAGHATAFHNTPNCTDPTQPLNAWGVGATQAVLNQTLGDQSVVALGVAEAWNCGNPESLRQALGWKEQSGEQNGVAMIARYGFAGPLQWQQLDTALNTTPTDTMWVLRAPVCLDAACTQSLPVYTTHWYGTGASSATTFTHQAQQTLAFLNATAGTGPHILGGDFNVFEGSAMVCSQSPNNTALPILRGGGYRDAWVTIHGTAEGYTGMADRAGCGSPEGYTWKQIDYAWTTAAIQPIDIQRFGMMMPGDASPSDHYGIVVTLPLPAAPSAAPGDIVLYAKNATAITGAWSLVNDTTAAGGVRMTNPDMGAVKLASASASPASAFELPFTAEAGKAYRLWIRGKAENDSWQNDSTFVQFSGSLDATGAPAFRIGTTAATVVSIEEASGAGVSGWGWQDNGYGVLGPAIYFDGTPQKLRIQVREDGLSIDQIVLSPVAYATTAPGAAKNDMTILPLPVIVPPPATTGDIVLYAKNATAMSGTWSRVNDTTAAGGVRVANPDAGAAKLASASASPASYFELPFTAQAGKAYRLWIRGRAENDSWQNDSTFVQFSGSRDAAGTAAFRIGTTAATVVSIEEASSAGVSGWGWQDNGYGSVGPAIYFDGTPQTLRVQVREDGLSIDQIVLSPVTYGAVAPGAAKNDTTILPETAAAATPIVPPIPTPTPAPTPVPAPTPPPVTSSTLRLLQWNTHHGGFGTDNIYSPDRLATWAASMHPDVVMLNEVERLTPSWGNENQPEVYKNLLQQKTGKTWYYIFAQEYGQWTATGKGNMILSTVPFESTTLYELVNNGDRSIGSGVITWNGRRVTLVLTHLDPYSQPLRLTQAQEVTWWAAPQPENKILTGDMNAWPDQTSIAYLNTLYNDSWSVAAARGMALAFLGNDGQTKNGRIDYIFYSKASADLSVVSSQVYDTRDANGVMPSDHRPVLTTFSIR